MIGPQRADCPIEVASLLFFDIETTGLRPDRGAQITEIALVNHTGICFDWKHERDSSELSGQLITLFGHFRNSVVVGHNLQFDFRFVAYEADRRDLRGPTVRFIDTLGLARRLLDRISDARLEVLLSHFDLSPDGELHTAIGDARATRALFWKLVEHGNLNMLADAGLKRLNWTTF